MNLFGAGEQVTITPTFGLDGDGNPIDNGTPFAAEALVAPGNTSFQYNNTGDVDTAEFTLYLPIGTAVKDDDLIEVRTRTCLARVREWRDPWPGGDPIECLEVLCKSTTGAS